MAWIPFSDAAAFGVAPWVLAAINASCSYCFWHVNTLWAVELTGNAAANDTWGAVPGTSVHNIGRQGNGYTIEDNYIDGNGRCALLKVEVGPFVFPPRV